jgi:hypothetical protein
VPDDGLSAEDRTALGWAVTTDHPLGVEIVERARRGADPLPPEKAAANVAAVRAAWEAAGRPPPQPHLHRTPLALAGGVTVVGVTFVADDPYTRDDGAPSFGLYLDERWTPPWPHAHVDWPDFGLPSDLDAFRESLRDALERARRGERVEIGCWGGHGRTGTALACLAVLAGTPNHDAVDLVRSSYCEKAVETAAQEAFVRAFS